TSNWIFRIKNLVRGDDREAQASHLKFYTDDSLEVSEDLLLHVAHISEGHVVEKFLQAINDTVAKCYKLLVFQSVCKLLPLAVILLGPALLGLFLEAPGPGPRVFHLALYLGAPFLVEDRTNQDQRLRNKRESNLHHWAQVSVFYLIHTLVYYGHIGSRYILVIPGDLVLGLVYLV
ncbi:hypothetical protein PHMEG_00021630, partial [Phytophthora megakarya]